MSKNHSTLAQKPSKPTPDFPLFPHASGQWAKKIRGRIYYFGVWADPAAALKRYLAEKDDLRAGRIPRTTPADVTVKTLANEFLNLKQDKVQVGELSPRTFLDYKLAADLVVAYFGKHRAVQDIRPEDFALMRNALAKRYGPHMLGKMIQYVRMIFKFGIENQLIDKPVVFGQGFNRPSKKTIRLHRAKQGPKLFDAEEIHRMLEIASTQLKAMILLGVNCGFGNADCANLERRHVDLERGVIDFPRPKTGIGRRCVLWPETMAAIEAAIAARPTHKGEDDAGKVFITKYGFGWGKDTSDSPITKETAKILKKLGINGHRNFYALRHSFRTIADEAKDQPAADYIMGHESTHMSTVYRERIGDERLRAVVDHVRDWLFAGKEGDA